MRHIIDCWVTFDVLYDSNRSYLGLGYIFDSRSYKLDQAGGRLVPILSRDIHEADENNTSTSGERELSRQRVFGVPVPRSR